MRDWKIHCSSPAGIKATGRKEKISRIMAEDRKNNGLHPGRYKNVKFYSMPFGADQTNPEIFVSANRNGIARA